MRFLVKAAAVATLITLTACGESPSEQAAENIEDAAENQADMFEAQAENQTNEVLEDRLEEKAEATREQGDERADEVEDNDAVTTNAADPAMADTAGM